MFIEVNSVSPKPTKLIINLNHVVEIAPLVRGGCAITFANQEGGSIKTMNVSDDYSAFKQFAIETVTAADIAKKVEKMRGSSPKTIIKTAATGGVEIDNPAFGQSEPA